MKADFHGERVSLMEPLVLGSGSPRRGEIGDLAMELGLRSTAFRAALPAGVVGALAELVRAMNCYYSNLIEGHDTHPVEIERALRNDYSQDRRKRDLQLEARAHIAVQRWIDEGGLGPLEAVSVEGIREIHRRFCEELPEDLRWVEDPKTGERLAVVPGELRGRDVQVGEHVAISAGAVPVFLERFAGVYGSLSRSESVVAAAAAHHRLLWIHPFLDGNGRVARLMSHAQMRGLLDTGAVWSVARGLARNVGQYKQLLADSSEEALGEFTVFFLRVCLDQVSFMDSLMEPGRLLGRIRGWAEDEVRAGRLPAKAGVVLEAVLYRGELARGEVEQVLDVGDRQARRVTSALLARGALTADGARGPLRLAFPAALAGAWMPGLFPEFG